MRLTRLSINGVTSPPQKNDSTEMKRRSFTEKKRILEMFEQI